MGQAISSLRRFYLSTAAVVTFAIIWFTNSVLFPGQVPSPQDTVLYLVDNILVPGPRGWTALDHLYFSLRRAILITLVALLLAIAIGIWMNYSRHIRDFVETWIPFWLTIPDVAVIVILMVAFGFEEWVLLATIIGIITPQGIINIWEGVQDVDQELISMAQTFDSDKQHIIRNIYLPHLFSYILPSFRYMFGGAWKVVLVGEALGLNNGLGAVIRFWFSQGEVQPIVAYLLLFVMVMLVIEYAILNPIQTKLFAWREAPAME
jgi:NitT/TauT family transport system permease protein